MISFIKGNLETILNNTIIIENNDIGYKIIVYNETLLKLPKIGEPIKIFTHMNVREDDISLYGFLSMEELNLFNIITNVSGIGPKTALNILGNITPTNLIIAIVSEDVNSLSSLPGIGKKTAQRMILELKDKMKQDISIESNNIPDNTNIKDAIEALVTLGYNKNESKNIVSKIATSDMSVEEIIKKALKKFI